jgi:hypothetical protein
MENKPMMLQLAETLQYHFPDNHEISTQYFIIRYPEVTITNTNKKSHLIKDLYIKQGYEILDETLFLRGYPKGFRGRLSLAEVASDYSHSHIKGIAYNFKDFCIGPSEIANILTGGGISGIKDIAGLEAYLMCLTNLAHWESIAGVPYRYIKNIKIPEPIQQRFTFNRIEVRWIFSKLDVEKLCLIDGYIQNNDYIKSIIEEMANHFKRYEVFIEVDSEGKPIVDFNQDLISILNDRGFYKDTPEDKVYVKKPGIKYKGKHIPIVFDPYDEYECKSIVKDSKKVLNMNFLAVVLSKLNIYITEIKSLKDESKREIARRQRESFAQANYPNENILSDIVVMS